MYTWMITNKWQLILFNIVLFTTTHCYTLLQSQPSRFKNVDSRNMLVWNVVPTLFKMPNPPKALSSKRKAPKIRLPIPQKRKSITKTQVVISFIVFTKTIQDCSNINSSCIYCRLVNDVYYLLYYFTNTIQVLLCWHYSWLFESCFIFYLLHVG